MRALLVAACLLLGGCSHFAEDDWLGEDKALHFASSAALAAAGMQMAHDRGLRGARQARFGLSFSPPSASARSSTTAVPPAAAGAGRTSPGTWPAPPPATVSTRPPSDALAFCPWLLEPSPYTSAHSEASMSALSTLAQHVTRRPQRIALLAQIAELGSITRAAKAVGISYKGAWDAIDELNNLAERPLVERSVGGKGGGGARLTAEGERLLALYRRLEALQAQVLQAAEDAEDLNLIGRLMLRTSARNQLHGRVLSIHGEGFHDRIAIELPGQQRIEALITRASTEQLELGRGRPVLALIKAGWLDVGLEPREDQPNQLHGTLEEILAAKAGPSEVRIALGSGLTLCALLSGERLASLGLKKGQKVIASFDPAQVLLGTPL